jgi:transketolase
MVVISPCDAIEARKATIAAAQTTDPTYIRLARNNTPVITTDDTPFEIGKAHIVYDEEGDADVAIIATGHLVYESILAAKELEERGMKVIVCNMSTIKPLDINIINELVKDAGALVTVEEHQILGGMGSAVAEYVTSHNPVPIEFIGIKDEFGQSGTPEELMEHYELGVSHIIQAAEKVVSRK